MILSIKCREGVEYTLLRGLDYVDTAGVSQGRGSEVNTPSERKQN
jgi:hypothetical protein